jgi:hypothetical protein
MQYVGLSGATSAVRGNAAAETGINLNGISCRFSPQFKDYLNDFQGIKRGFAIPDKLDREVTFDGEVTLTTGIMAMKFITAYVFANSTMTGLFEATNGGGNSGGFYLDEITPGSTRDGWLSVSGRASASPNIA